MLGLLELLLHVYVETPLAFKVAEFPAQIVTEETEMLGLLVMEMVVTAELTQPAEDVPITV
jgi:hypothetical protein